MTSISDRRAARGAEFMDKVRPGWFDEIRLDDLDIGSPMDCILGQIYGDFSNGCRQLEMSFYRSYFGYGFEGGLLWMFSEVFFKPSGLTRAWRREIEQRRVQDFLMRARQEKSEQEAAMASA